MDPWDALTYLLLQAGGEVRFEYRDDELCMQVESSDDLTIEAAQSLAVALGGDGAEVKEEA